MNDMTCKISLTPLKGTEYRPGYRDSDCRRLFGTLGVSPELSFTRQEFFSRGSEYAKGHSISGVQEKLSLVIDQGQLVPIHGGGGRFILKPSPEAYPYAAQNEHAGMVFGQAAGIETAPCGLVSFPGGELVYITRRFDRTPDGSRLAQEDLLQVADLPTQDKYSLSYEEAGHLISKATNGKSAPVLEMIKRVILAYVMGNNDLHLKNISLQRAPRPEVTHYYDRLAPNYDVLFCDSIGGAGDTDFLALDLLANDETTPQFDHYGYYTQADFYALAQRLAIRPKPVQSYINQLLARQSALLRVIERSFMPEPMKLKAISQVEGRLNALNTNYERN